ncbi:hypothetical protein NQ315_012122 [Exocentrus adspersus]|uniref:Uncharacterized protein n=1 Tax=Exocentrus adspersus TaxID=1586481 RepID=A0AAV8VYN3_9CUCU|nr:hypothetical protein NQ315_012122 [Exocentrus adspersus]
MATELVELLGEHNIHDSITKTGKYKYIYILTSPIYQTKYFTFLSNKGVDSDIFCAITKIN